MQAALTLRHALQAGAALGVDRLDTQLLLLHALGRPAHHRAWLLAHDGDVLPDDTHRRFQQLAQRRAAGEPVAYLIGEKEFFGLALAVDRRVLVPRPDTETLVDWALELLAGRTDVRVLDLGTGSGAIAIALAVALGLRGCLAQVTAVDASEDALVVAAANAARHAPGVQLRSGHWLRGHAGCYHLIASNPPYIADGDPHLPALAHEPRAALVAGTDGLDDIREIVADAPAHLHAGGWLLLEHGWDQAGAVQSLLAARGFADVQGRADIAGTARCAAGRWPHGTSAPSDTGAARG